MKFIENEGIDYIFSKYNINKDHLISWFSYREIAINNINLELGYSCVLEQISDGDLCNICTPYTQDSCDGCIFQQIDKSHKDALKIFEYCKNIINK